MKKTYLLVIGLTAAISLYVMPTQTFAGGRHGRAHGYNSYGGSFGFFFGVPIYPRYYAPPRYHAPPPKYYHRPGKPHWRSYGRGPHKDYRPRVKHYRKHYRKYYGKHRRPPVHHHGGYGYR